jgi:Do/DeqQ family serine protease
MKKIVSYLILSFFTALITILIFKYTDVNNAESTEKKQLVLPSQLVSNPINYNLTNVDFTKAAEKTINTVVHVKNTTTSMGYNSIQDLMFGKPSNRAQIGSGSGVIISPDGYIITNNHVIEDAELIEITTNDNKTYEAELIGADDKTDIALLKINAASALPYTIFGDSNSTKVGEWVLAVGNPFNLTSTVTAGIISAKSRDLSGQNTQSFIQTDAAVNPGNSGGALVNLNGSLIGINTAISSQTGSYIGYSFAVPSNIARKVIEDIMEYGNVQNGVLGVMGGALNGENAKELGTNLTQGFFVTEVYEGSGAQMAGIKKGDIITAIDGVKISKFSELKGFLNTKNPNDIVSVSLHREDKQLVKNVQLAKQSTVNLPPVGILKELSEKELSEMEFDHGLVIQELSEYNRKEWMQDGINNGDIVTSINGFKVNSISDVQDALKKFNNTAYRVEILKDRREKVVYRFR